MTDYNKFSKTQPLVQFQTKGALAGIVQSQGSSGSRILDFSVTQMLEQSNIPLQERGRIRTSLEEAISRNQVAPIVRKFQQIGLGQKFTEHVQWLSSEGGERFIEREMPHLVSSSPIMNLPGSVDWKTLNTGSGNLKDLAAQMERNLSASMGLRANQPAIQIAHVGGSQARFMAEGIEQISNVHEFNFQIRSMGINEKLAFYEPSERGYLAQSSSSIGKGFSKGDSIFVTPKHFFTDIREDRVSGELKMSRFSDPVRKPTEVFNAQKSGYWQFQQNQLEQFGRRVQEIEQNPNLPHSSKKQRILNLFQKFRQENEKNQFFVGSGGTMRGDMSRSGIGSYTQNQLSRAAFFRNTAGASYALGEISSATDPNIAMKIQAAMYKEGVVMSGSSGQAAKLRGIMNPGYTSGVQTLPHVEPHKALSDLSFVGGKGKEVDLFRSQVTQESLVPEESFRPKGRRLVSTVLPKEGTGSLSKSLGFGISEMLTPDGAALVTEDAFRSGALDVGSAGVHEISSVGPGGQGRAWMGRTTGAIFEGGQVYAASDIGKKSPIQIPGFRTLLEQGEELDFLKAVGAESSEDFQKKFKGGILLESEEYLGLDPASGRQVKISKNLHATESIVDVGPGSGRGSIKIHTGRRISPVEVGGAFAAHDTKIVGSFQTKIGEAQKVEIDSVKSGDVEEFLKKSSLSLDDESAKRVASKAQIYFNPGIMEDPAVKLTQMAGAAQFQIDEMLLKVGSEKSIMQDEAKQALKRLANLSSEDFLKHTSSGGIMNELKKLGYATSKNIKRVQETLMSQTAVTMEEKLAAVSLALFGNLDETSKMKAVSNIFAPYTQWGTDQGYNTFGKNDPALITKAYHSWGGEATAKQINWKNGKEFENMINRVFASTTMGSELRKARTHMLSYSAGFTPKDAGALLGAGARASIEPRFFDIAMMEPNLQPAFKEITKRGTNFVPVMGKLKQTLLGTAPAGLGAAESLGDLLSPQGVGRIGAKDLVVDLGLSKEVIQATEQKMRELNPNLGAKLTPHLYLPGGEDVRGMGLMVSGTGVEKEKPLRNIFTNYLKEVHGARNLSVSRRADVIAKATQSFQSDLGLMFQQQFFGAPGGSAAGMTRMRPSGSALLKFRPLGMDFMKMMGGLGDEAASDFEQKWSTRRSGLPGAEQEYLKTFKQQFKRTIDSGESIGKQIFLSEKAAEKMFSEAIVSAGDDTNLVENLKKQHQALREGRSVLGVIGRDPAIGLRSATSGRMWLDRFSARSATQDYAKNAATFVEYTKEHMAKGTSASKATGMFLTSIAQDLNADWDGDQVKVFLAAKKESQDALQQMMKQEHGHALRYQAIKDVAKESFQIYKSGEGSALSSAFQASTQEVLGPQTEASLARSSKVLQSTLAHSATGTVVPQISNTFTEMKFMLSQSKTLAANEARDLFRFFEAAEQIPISSKRLSSAADKGLEFANQVKRLQAAMLSNNSEARTKALDTVFDMLANKEVIKDIAYKKSSEAAGAFLEERDYVNMKANAHKVIQEFSERVEDKDLFKFFRKNQANLARSLQGGQLSIPGLLEVFDRHTKDFQKVFGHKIDMPAGSVDLSHAPVARNVISTINEATQEAGRNAAGRLPSKGIVGLAMTAAAGMLVAGTAGIALGPTWTDAQSGGTYADPDLLFPEELEQKNAMLHGNSMPTPITGHLATPSYEATIHMPQGAYSPATLIGRLGTVMASHGASGRLDMQDHRGSLDIFSLNRIKNEII